jgi:hypothetical protein
MQKWQRIESRISRFLVKCMQPLFSLFHNNLVDSQTAKSLFVDLTNSSNFLHIDSVPHSLPRNCFYPGTVLRYTGAFIVRMTINYLQATVRCYGRTSDDRWYGNALGNLWRHPTTASKEAATRTHCTRQLVCNSSPVFEFSASTDETDRWSLHSWTLSLARNMATPCRFALILQNQYIALSNAPTL